MGIKKGVHLSFSYVLKQARKSDITEPRSCSCLMVWLGTLRARIESFVGIVSLLYCLTFLSSAWRELLSIWSVLRVEMVDDEEQVWVESGSNGEMEIGIGSFLVPIPVEGYLEAGGLS